MLTRSTCTPPHYGVGKGICSSSRTNNIQSHTNAISYRWLVNLGSSVFSSILLCHLPEPKQSEVNITLVQEPDLSWPCAYPPHWTPNNQGLSAVAGGEGAAAATRKGLRVVRSCTKVNATRRTLSLLRKGQGNIRRCRLRRLR